MAIAPAPARSEEIDIDSLASLIVAAKKEEKLAKDARVELEEMLYARLENQTIEGASKTINLDDHDVTIARKFSRKVDQKLATGIYSEWPAGAMFPCSSVWKENKDAYNLLPDDLKQLYDGCITEKPLKVSVSVKRRD